MPFEPLRERLLKAGIAPRHVRRYLRELSDHLEDLVTDQRQAGQDADTALSRARALLGQDEELVAAMLARPELKSWAARVPWLVFTLLPPVATAAGFFAAMLPLVLIANLHGMIGHNEITAPGWFQSLAQATALAANLILAPGLVLLLAWTAWRQRLNGLWVLLAAALIALLGLHMTALFPAPGMRGGELAVGTLLRGPSFIAPEVTAQYKLYLVQAFLTLAPALWLLRQRPVQS